MGLFDIFRRIHKRSADTPDAPEPPRSPGNVITWPFCIPSGKGVDYVGSSELAMRIAAVYRCVDILSKGIAQLPLEIKTNRGGYFAVDESDPLNYLLAVRPNSRHTSFEFMRNMMIQVVTQGNAYVVPRFGEGGWEELVLVSPGCCTYEKVQNIYMISDAVNRLVGVFNPDEVIHVRNMSLDGGYTGMSTISYASRVLAITANADSENIETFKNGGLVRGFVSGNSGTVGFGTVQDTQLDSVASNIEKQLGSGKNIFSLPGEMKFSQISLSPADIELLATKTFNVLEICRFFGVHPDKVFAQQSSNYKASEMSQVAFLTDTLQPYLRQIELEFQAKLIPRTLYGQYRIDFNIDSLMQTDLATQASYMEKTIATGTRTVNYWRKRFGQEPVKGGDEVMVSANLVPLNSSKLWGDNQMVKFEMEEKL